MARAMAGKGVRDAFMVVDYSVLTARRRKHGRI
jgi:hypothetical protein